jgi:hypothetical protein
MWTKIRNKVKSIRIFWRLFVINQILKRIENKLKVRDNEHRL